MENNRGRPKFLTPNLNAWFVANYPDHSTEYLISELTKLIDEERDKELKNMREKRSFLNDKEKSLLDKKMNRLKVRVFITPRTITNLAARKGLRKSINYIIRMKQEKAEKMNLKKVIKSAKPITNITAAIRDLPLNHSKAYKVESTSKMLSFSTILTRWNSCEGRQKDMRASARYDYKNLIIILKKIPL